MLAPSLTYLGGPSNTSPPPSRLTFGPELATQPPAFTFPTLLPEGPNVGSNSGGFGGGAPPPDPPPFPQGQGQGRSRPSTEPRFKSEPEREVRVKNKNGAVDGESRLGEREKATLGKSGKSYHIILLNSDRILRPRGHFLSAYAYPGIVNTALRSRTF